MYQQPLYNFNAADILSRKRIFITGTSHNQLKHLPKEIVSSTPKVGAKIYHRKENFPAMSSKRKVKRNLL